MFDDSISAPMSAIANAFWFSSATPNYRLQSQIAAENAHRHFYSRTALWSSHDVPLAQAAIDRAAER